MADGLPTIDTSSYPKPTAGPSVLDTLGKLQGIEQQQVSIDQSKLKLVNDRYGVVSKELQGLLGDPEVDFNKVAARTQNLVNLGLMPAPMMAQFLKDVPTDKASIPKYIEMKVKQAQSIMDAINYAHGQPGTMDTGQTVQPVRTSPAPGFGIRSEGPPIQKQIPPTTEGVDENGQPKLLGPQTPQLAPGTVTAPPALPVGPVNNPAIRGPSANFGGNVIGAEVGPNLTGRLPIQPINRVAQGFPNVPRGPATGLPPGVAEAEKFAGTGSGEHLNKERALGANFQRDVFPLAQAIPALESLGTKGTGPGTETINNLKSFVLSNVPGVKESDFSGTVKDYDKAKKYLTDFVNQTGSTGTNDKLAAAFAGNPSVGISNAAAVDVAKSALALRRMQQARLLEFEALNKPASQFSKWSAQRTNELDPRAFGVDVMSPEAKVKLRQQLDKNPKERDRFNKSLELAHRYEFITPQGQ